MYYNDPRNNESANQATQIFQFFAGSSEHLNKQQFRTLFLAAGEEVIENDFEDLFGEVDDDRDGRISLEEFTNWFKKDDSYEYNMRTKPLRDIKERLKNPAFYRSLQYFMGKNPGTSSSNMNSDSSIMDIDLALKVGNLHHQQPEWGFDLKFENLSSPAAPSIIIELTYQDGIDFQEVSHKISTLASIGSQMIGMGAPNAPSQITIEGRPGISVTVPLSPMHPVVMMAPMFLSIIKHLHLKLHLSQTLETLDTDTCLVDAGLKFQGQRSAFQMLAPMVGSMGVDSKLWTLLTLVNNVHLSFGLDQLNNFMDGKLKQQFNPQSSAQGKAGLARVLGGMLANMGLQEMLPLPVKNLHKIQVRLGTQQFTLSGINFDISFLFGTPSSGFEDPHRAHSPGSGSVSGSQARVLYTFTGEGGIELSVQQGDIVTVISKDPTGWWVVADKHGAQGHVPAGYLEELGLERLPEIEQYEM
jgi:hypothetical protein